MFIATATGCHSDVACDHKTKRMHLNLTKRQLFNNYPTKSHGILPARLSRIIVLLFNKLITKLTILSGQEKTLLFTV